jgi:uncharacterized protein YbjQ (UPF0145 family)
MKAKLFILLTLTLITVSCSTVSKIQTDDVQLTNLIATNNLLVEVYSTKVAAKNYKIIGQVVACADAGEDSKVAVNLLKAEASSLGADAIIDLRLAISMGYWTNGIKATGTAVKYN